MHGPTPQFYQSISGFLGTYYLLIAVMNGVVAYRDWMSGKSFTLFQIGAFKITSAIIWLCFAMLLLVASPIAYSGDPRLMVFVSLPQGLRDFINALMNPTTYTVLAMIFLGILFVTRRWWSQPLAAYIILNAALIFMGLSMTDYNFSQIITKADNVPIVGLIFLLGFFTWLATYQACSTTSATGKACRLWKNWMTKRSWSGLTWSIPNSSAWSL